MKKFMILTISLLALTGCEGTQEQKDRDAEMRIEKFNYEGHQYLLYKDFSSLGMTHDPNCPCHEKEN